MHYFFEGKCVDEAKKAMIMIFVYLLGGLVAMISFVRLTQ